MTTLLLTSILKNMLQATQAKFPKPLRQCQVVCIPTAANVYAADNRPWFDEEVAAVKKSCANFVMCDLATSTALQVVEALAEADVIYVTGGNTYYALEQAQKTNFASALKSFFQRGGVYIGSSAGTVLACPRIDFIGDADDRTQATLTSMQGLNLVPFLVMPHIDHLKYGPAGLNALRAAPEGGLAISDTQALWVHNNVVEFIQA